MFNEFLSISGRRVTALRNEKEKKEDRKEVEQAQKTGAEGLARRHSCKKLALEESSIGSRSPFSVLSYVEERHGNGIESQRVPVR